ncbi:MAG: ammonium transporter [Saccharofermentanaceae bacterium]|nr:ammonium transporter [Clostridia bacterium]HOO49445.1 ammonium transporter [Saccharofermentans sp.]HPE27250.1 ammonium transporter [Saccharofermentans sp.]HPJ81451.1 ammonium transporter [Saccharofermentans sp.]HPQ32635.1 ammonium transporter [Saccharofermentans sp.]
MNSADTGFMLICSAMVLFMTPGLSLFYGGFVRRKNVLNTIMMSTLMIGLAIVMWVAFGYSLSFGGNHFGIIGDFRNAFFNGIGSKPGSYSDSIPAYVYAAFQMMFAIITPALISGAVAERMKFKAYFIFMALWSIIVYYPMAHMVWGQGGFLASIGAVDFAGGNVVHISSGFSALVLCILLGKRKGYDTQSYRTHNIPMIAIGAFVLLFGWFGFNAGSALKADGLAAHAFITTAVSAGAAMLSWIIIEWKHNGTPSLVGAVTGIVAGLVAITPGAGFVPVWAALIIGALVSPLCYFFISVVKKHFGYDDALDAFGCHGIGGVWGGIATGLFAQKSINPIAQWDGLVFGETRLILAQVISILVTIVVAIVGTLICAGVTRVFTPLKTNKREEDIGLDSSEHGESGYPSFNGLD